MLACVQLCPPVSTGKMGREGPGEPGRLAGRRPARLSYDLTATITLSYCTTPTPQDHRTTGHTTWVLVSRYCQVSIFNVSTEERKREYHPLHMYYYSSLIPVFYINLFFLSIQLLTTFLQGFLDLDSCPKTLRYHLALPLASKF